MKPIPGSTSRIAVWALTAALLAAHVTGSLCAIDCLSAVPTAGAPGVSATAAHCGTAAAASGETRITGHARACDEHSVTTSMASAPARSFGIALPTTPLSVVPEARAQLDRERLPLPLPDDHSPPRAPVPLRI